LMLFIALHFLARSEMKESGDEDQVARGTFEIGSELVAVKLSCL